VRVKAYSHEQLEKIGGDIFHISYIKLEMNLQIRTFLEMSMRFPPHMPELWWKETSKKAKELETELKDLPSTLEDAIKLEKENVSARPFNDLEYKIPYSLLKTFKKDAYLRPDSLSKLIKAFLDASKVENIDGRTVMSYLTRVGEFYSELSNIKSFYKEYRRDFQESYKNLLDEMEYSKDDIPEYSKVLSTFKKAKKLIDALVDYVKLSSSVSDKVQAWTERRDIGMRYHFGGEKVMPKHSKLETLYHATPYVKEILSSGFKTKSELGGKSSLGGSAQASTSDYKKQGISFTGDIQIARAIVKSLIEVIKISKGEIGLMDVMRMFKSETPSTDKFSSAFTSRMGSRKLNYSHRDSSSANRENVFELYRRYLGTTKLRYNPLFFAVGVEDFENLDENNVGVIAAVVEMDKVGYYLPSMEEFRVPKDAIRKIWKV